MRGFPTIKYGDPSDLQAYEGGRDEKALKKFAEEKLVPMCSVKNIDLCSADKKAELEKYMALDTEELTKLITAQEDELKQIEEEFKKSVEGLQKLYEGYTKDKEEKMAKLKDGGLGLMKSVKASRKGASKDELIGVERRGVLPDEPLKLLPLPRTGGEGRLAQPGLWPVV